MSCFLGSSGEMGSALASYASQRVWAARNTSARLSKLVTALKCGTGMLLGSASEGGKALYSQLLATSMEISRLSGAICGAAAASVKNPANGKATRVEKCMVGLDLSFIYLISWDRGVWCQ